VQAARWEGKLQLIVIKKYGKPIDNKKLCPAEDARLEVASSPSSLLSDNAIKACLPLLLSFSTLGSW
jgi:hypothetical protein